nr:MAG TPA: hypothetical protein [Caudoviricetes sp.]
MTCYITYGIMITWTKFKYSVYISFKRMWLNPI